MGDSYKAAKEAFVSGTNGSTILHVHMISSVALVCHSLVFEVSISYTNSNQSSIALHSALISRLPSSRQIHFPTAWLILVFPLLLSMTLFATSPALLSVLLLFPAGLLLLIPPRQSGTPLPSPNPMTPPSPRHSSFSLSPIPTPVPASVSQVAVLPALTVYRAHMLLMTTLAILAVDFPVFPRALAKCETFGVSLVDIFCNLYLCELILTLIRWT